MNLPKSVEDYKIIRQVRLVSNEMRISKATQTMHWSWTVDLEDKEIQCELSTKPTCKCTATEAMTESISEKDAETGATVASQATQSGSISENESNPTFSMSDG